jgi:hypothetical protein
MTDSASSLHVAANDVAHADGALQDIGRDTQR